MRRLLLDLRRVLAAPSRNPRMAVVLGRLLGLAFLICFGTGLYSHFLQDPLPFMHFATRPTTLYQLTQGIHITAGIACFPLLFGKLYAVFPELFQAPPLKSVPDALARGSIAIFVASSLVQIVTGLLNTFQWYPFPFPFRQTHFALSFVIIGSLAIHIAVKLPVIARYWTHAKSFDADGNLVLDEEDRPKTPAEVHAELVRTGTEPVGPLSRRFDFFTGRVIRWIDSTPPRLQPPVVPETADADETVTDEPSADEPVAEEAVRSVTGSHDEDALRADRISRRGFVATISVATAAVVALTAGQSFRILDALNLFAPRKNDVGPNHLPINRTAKAAQVTDALTGDDWALEVKRGTSVRRYSRPQLLAMEQHSVELPIACVEGWSQLATWKGVRLRDLMDGVGAHPDEDLRLTSLEVSGGYRVTEMGHEYVQDELTLVALELNGDTLDIDHGYPARMIAPGRPGVLQTKWLSTLEVI